MIYATKYHGSFTDNNSDTIDIYINQKDFAGSAEELLLDDNPLVITYSPKDFDAQLFSGGCTINIINQSTNFFKYDSLFSVPQRNNQVYIVKTSDRLDSSIILFDGYVLPEMYTSTLEKNIKLTIPANDQLSLLDRYTPWKLVDTYGANGTTAYRADEFISGIDLIDNIIWDLDVTNLVAINNSLYNVNYAKNPSTTLFQNVFYDARNFSDNKGTFNDKVCIEKALKPFYSRMYYHDGKWMIERVSDIGTTNKIMTVYDLTSDTSSFTTTYYTDKNDRIDIGNHLLLSKTANLTYQPGYEKVVLTLKYTRPDNLVENYYNFPDMSYYKRDIATSSTKPLPKLRKWMFSTASDTSMYLTPYNDTLLEHGVYWWYTSNYSMQPPGPSNIWGRSQFLSTMFQFMKTTPKTSIDVKFDYSVDPLWVTPNYHVKGGFALRATDANGANWWIAKSKRDDASTFWSATEYRFDVSSLVSDLDNYQFTVNEQIDLTEAINNSISHIKAGYWFYQMNVSTAIKTQGWLNDGFMTLPSLASVNQMYLDIYGMQKATLNGPFALTKTQMGNVNVTIPPPSYPNIIEASMGYFNDIKNVELEVFDCSTILYVNGIYNRDPSNYLNVIGQWAEPRSITWLSIQKQLVQDLAQMYKSPRYTLTADVISKDSSTWSLGNIYTHSRILDASGAPLEFICNGYEYNVRKSTYRLSLEQYIADAGYRIDASAGTSSGNASEGPAPEPPVSYNWYVDTSDMYFNYDTRNSCRGAGGFYFDISCNIDWYLTYSTYYLDVTPTSGHGNEIITVTPNWNSTGFDADITVYPQSYLGFSNKIVPVHQLATGQSCP